METTSSKLKQGMKRLLIAASVAAALPVAAFAQSATPTPGAGPGSPPAHQWHRGPGGERGMEGRSFGHHMHGRHGHHHGMGFLRGVKLNDAQKDKIFQIRHAMAPQAYEKMKIVRKSREDLRGMASSANYDEGRAKAAIDAGARAKADLQLMRIKSQHEIFAMLTPEQKAQVEQNRQNFLNHRMSMGERGGPGSGGTRVQ